MAELKISCVSVIFSEKRGTDLALCKNWELVVQCELIHKMVNYERKLSFPA